MVMRYTQLKKFLLNIVRNMNLIIQQLIMSLLIIKNLKSIKHIDVQRIAM